jgi:hypothetical protein
MIWEEDFGMMYGTRSLRMQVNIRVSSLKADEDINLVFSSH